MSTTPTGTVSITAYRFRYEEVDACLRSVLDMLAPDSMAEDQEAHLDPDDLAIVIRDDNYAALLYEQAQLLDEEAERRQFKKHHRHAFSQVFTIPPRQLLKTPVGRFVTTLYDIWEGSHLAIDPDQFETLLASGWLGHKVQRSTDRFQMVRAQYFERCFDEASWKDHLRELKANLPLLTSLDRLPAGAVDVEVINLWVRVIETLHQLCDRIFSGPEQSLSKQINHLLEELAAVRDEHDRAVFEDERKVIERIRDELLPLLEQDHALGVKPGELGLILNKLAEVRLVEEGHGDRERVSVVMPEGLDGVSKRVVFFLGCDHTSMPRYSKDPWPFMDSDPEGYLERQIHHERHLFRAVVDAAQDHLILSYAQFADGTRLRPSVYLREVMELTGNIQGATDSVTSQIKVPHVAVIPQSLVARRDTYGLDELAHFRLCPYRYKMERMDLHAGRHTSSWDLQQLARATWLNRLLGYLVTNGVSARGVEGVRAMFSEAKNAVRSEVGDLFPGLQPHELMQIERGVDSTLDYQEQRWYGKYYEDKLLKVVHSQDYDLLHPIQLVDDKTRRAISVAWEVQYAFYLDYFGSARVSPFTQNHVSQEWLQYGKGGASTNAHEHDRKLGEIEVFETQYEAVKWWVNRLKICFAHEARERGFNLSKSQRELADRYHDIKEELLSIVSQVERGYYPKNPGDHCNKCPVHSTCLGIEIW